MRLDYMIIRAPFAGVITAKRASPEAVAVRLLALRRIRRRDRHDRRVLVAYVGADVNEANLSSSGRTSRPRSRPTRCPTSHHGRLRQIVPAADRQGRPCASRWRLDADDHVLPDLSARVAFTSEATAGKTSRSRILIPKNALATVDGKPGVFRLVEGRAQFTPVTPGDDVQGQLEIKEGLQGGERLASLTGGVQLKNGDRVRIEGEK
jgi:hypothetical protein